MKNASVLDRPVQVEGALADGIEDAVDRRIRQLLHELRLERCGVAAEVVQDRPIGEKRRASRRATVSGCISGWDVVSLFDRDVSIRRSRAGEGRKEPGIADQDLGVTEWRERDVRIASDLQVRLTIEELHRQRGR